MLSICNCWPCSIIRPTVTALVPPTPENLAEDCNKFVEFLINVVKQIPTGAFSVCHNWCKNRAYQLFSLIHDLMKYLSHKFPQMESYQLRGANKKENRRRKFNARETGSKFSMKNVYSLQNSLFPGLETHNSMKSLL